MSADAEERERKVKNQDVHRRRSRERRGARAPRGLPRQAAEEEGKKEVVKSALSEDRDRVKREREDELERERLQTQSAIWN